MLLSLPAFLTQSFMAGTSGIPVFEGVANVDPNDAANKLRAFADHHWPDCDMPDWNAMAYAEEAAA
jgi:hypothetical protein